MQQALPVFDLRLGVLRIEVGVPGEVGRPVDQVGAHVLGDELDQLARDVHRVAQRAQVVEDVVRRLVDAVDAQRVDDGGGIQDGQQLLGVHDRIPIAPAAPSPFSIAVAVLDGCAPDL